MDVWPSNGVHGAAGLADECGALRDDRPFTGVRDAGLSAVGAQPALGRWSMLASGPVAFRHLPSAASKPDAAPRAMTASGSDPVPTTGRWAGPVAYTCCVILAPPA